MEQTYRYRIYPTEKQIIDIRNTCSAVRFLYNKLLEDRTKTFRETDKWAPLSTEKYKQLPWMEQIDPFALVAAENQLKNAYRHFFHVLRTKKIVYDPDALQAAAEGAHDLKDCDIIGYPKFKRKKTTSESYQTKPSEVQLEKNAVVLPVLGRVRAYIHRPIPGDAKIAKCTILKKKSGRFYLLLLLKMPKPKWVEKMTKPLGVVFSPGQLVLRSDNKEVYFRHADPKLEKRIDKAYQTLKRRTPGSHRYEKQREYLAKLYEKRVDQRRDDLHKAARQIANDADIVCMEAPEVLARARYLRKNGLYDTVHDEAWWKFSRLVEQKVVAEGHYYWKVGRQHVLFGVCSSCGQVQAPKLFSSTFTCSACGITMAWEKNAVQSLYQEAERFAGQLTGN